MSILANRYASSAMKEIWSAESKIKAERNLWIAVMKAQAELGFDIPASAIADYEKVKNQVDLTSIDKREKELRHDVKCKGADRRVQCSRRSSIHPHRHDKSRPN